MKINFKINVRLKCRTFRIIQIQIIIDMRFNDIQ